MIKQQIAYYTSPAGKEFSFAAARFAGINPSSRVLDMGCGYGEGACNLASEFRCKITACDYSQENVEFARKLAVKRNVSHLIDFQKIDLTKADFSKLLMNWYWQRVECSLICPVRKVYRWPPAGYVQGAGLLSQI